MATDGQQVAAALERRLLTRALAAGDFGGLHLRFDPGVLTRYRDSGGKLIRTRSVGRITMPQWSLDVGIAPGDAWLHLPARDLLERVPERERPHWVEHLAPQPASAVYLQMSISPIACLDDGEPETWD
jgi:hypothetical protein